MPLVVVTLVFVAPGGWPRSRCSSPTCCSWWSSSRSPRSTRPPPRSIVGVVGGVLIIGMALVVGAMVLHGVRARRRGGGHRDGEPVRPRSESGCGAGSRRRCSGAPWSRGSSSCGERSRLDSDRSAIAVALTRVTHVDALYFAVLGAGNVLLDGFVAPSWSCSRSTRACAAKGSIWSCARRRRRRRREPVAAR